MANNYCQSTKKNSEKKHIKISLKKKKQKTKKRPKKDIKM